MDALKRSTTSLLRQPVKTIVLFLLIFILGTVTAGAISAVAAITNTDTNLRRQLRPLITFEIDQDAVHAAWEAGGGYHYEFTSPGAVAGLKLVENGQALSRYYPKQLDKSHHYHKLNIILTLL